MPDTVLHTVSGASLPGVQYFCTTRQGGVSTGPWASLNLGLHTDDDIAHVQSNRQRLQAMLPGAPVWLNQVHGTEVFDADVLPSQELNWPAVVPTADAVITSQLDRPLIIMTADCLPIVLVSSDGCALGLAHAGWRGLAAGVLENTLEALKRKTDSAVSWYAWIGPSISQPCFEVGDDVLGVFTDTDAQAARYFIRGKLPGKWQADLPGLAYRRLLQAGVGTIERSGLCTYTDSQQFFSYRRTPVTGRLATVAWLTAFCG
ncbi:peptidoglycan editing factor PgeF [Alcaligenaceae bacterium]|nr:peptidoglycan editing factor PgeF [Alcaligenaceae bacterium]